MSNPAETDPPNADFSNRRVMRWQSELLDLTLRNRLLNFKATLQTVPIQCNDIGLLEDTLSENKRLKLISRAEALESSAAPPRESELDPSAEIETRDLGGELRSALPPEQLLKQLTTLFRATRNDFSEGGSNTLFLSVGFLRWKKKADDQSSYLAPLLLVPVKLIRSAKDATFHLRQHEDEPRFNATLIQMLLRDFGIDLQNFEKCLGYSAPLPTGLKTPPS